MRIKVIVFTVSLILPFAAFAQQSGVLRWVDEDGNITYTDTPPPEASEYPKELKNHEGVTIGEIEGRKTEEERRAEREAAARKLRADLQLRQDRALLATYQSVEEIVMHRDRRIELFHAQSRVTELYIRNLRRSLASLNAEALNYKPYSSDPSAPLIDPELVTDIKEMEGTIAKHEGNLQKFKDEEVQIRNRFKNDINRFRDLKGIPATETTAQAVPE